MAIVLIFGLTTCVNPLSIIVPISLILALIILLIACVNPITLFVIISIVHLSIFCRVRSFFIIVSIVSILIVPTCVISLVVFIKIFSSIWIRVLIFDDITLLNLLILFFCSFFVFLLLSFELLSHFIVFKIDTFKPFEINFVRNIVGLGDSLHFVGCAVDVVISSEWILVRRNNTTSVVTFRGQRFCFVWSVSHLFN